MHPLPVAVLGIGLIAILANRKTSPKLGSKIDSPVATLPEGMAPPGLIGTVEETEETTFRDLWWSLNKKYRRRIMAILGSILALGTTAIVVTAPTVVGGVAMATATLALCALAMALYARKLQNKGSAGRAAEACRRLCSFFLFATEAGAQASGVAIETGDEDALAAQVDAQAAAGGGGDLTEESLDLVIDSYDAETVAAVEGVL